MIGGPKIIRNQNTEDGFCYHPYSACQISAPLEFGCHPVGGCGKARGLDAIARTSYAAAEITKNRHPRVQIRRWVGMYDKQLLENIFGVFRCDTGAKCRRPFASVWSEWFTPTLTVGSRFSSGETWPGRFILPEAVRNAPKAGHFWAFWPVRLPSVTPALPNQRRAPREGLSGSIWRIIVLLFDRVRKRRSAVGLSWKHARDGKMARADGAAGGPVSIPTLNHCDALTCTVKPS